jgi:hypothetical protein
MGVSGDLTRSLTSNFRLQTTKIDMVTVVVYNMLTIDVGGHHSGLGLTGQNIGPNLTL